MTVVVPPDPPHDLSCDPVPDLAAELPDDPAPDRPVVVLGLMGAGKTSVATLLSTRWGRPLRDSDADLERRFGRTAAALAAERGPEGLHDLEADHALRALAERPAPIVAAAASTVERAPCREAFGDALVVWLDGSPDVLSTRHRAGGHRPLFGGDVRRMLLEMDAARRPLFEEVADVRVVLADPADPEKVRGRTRLAVRAGLGIASAAASLAPTGRARG